MNKDAEDSNLSNQPEPKVKLENSNFPQVNKKPEIHKGKLKNTSNRKETLSILTSTKTNSKGSKDAQDREKENKQYKELIEQLKEDNEKNEKQLKAENEKKIKELKALIIIFELSASAFNLRIS